MVCKPPKSRASTNPVTLAGRRVSSRSTQLLRFGGAAGFQTPVEPGPGTDPTLAPASLMGALSSAGAETRWQGFAGGSAVGAHHPNANTCDSGDPRVAKDVGLASQLFYFLLRPVRRLRGGGGLSLSGSSSVAERGVQAPGEYAGRCIGDPASTDVGIDGPTCVGAEPTFPIYYASFIMVALFSVPQDGQSRFIGRMKRTKASGKNTIGNKTKPTQYRGLKVILTGFEQFVQSTIGIAGDLPFAVVVEAPRSGGISSLAQFSAESIDVRAGGRSSNQEVVYGYDQARTQAETARASARRHGHIQGHASEQGEVGRGSQASGYFAERICESRVRSVRRKNHQKAQAVALDISVTPCYHDRAKKVGRRPRWNSRRRPVPGNWVPDRVSLHNQSRASGQPQSVPTRRACLLGGTL